MGIVLGANQYGKAENRVVRIYRDTDRHEIRDLNVSTSLRGDFAAAHITGDQAQVLPTDTQKNTAFAFAKKHGDHLARGLRAGARPAAAGGHARPRRAAGAGRGVRLGPDSGHDHSFVRRAARSAPAWSPSAATRRTCCPGSRTWCVLKSTGSEFKGFLVDEYTTLAETDDRILATSLIANWRHVEHRCRLERVVRRGARRLLLETFATTYSRALQETLYAMGRAVLDAQPGHRRDPFSAPNKHHFLVDLRSPFEGLENPGEVFIAADRPYGLIEAR